MTACWVLQPAHLDATAEISTIRMLVQQRKQQVPDGGQRLAVVGSLVERQLGSQPAYADVGG